MDILYIYGYFLKAFHAPFSESGCSRRLRYWEKGFRKRDWERQLLDIPDSMSPAP